MLNVEINASHGRSSGQNTRLENPGGYSFKIETDVIVWSSAPISTVEISKGDYPLADVYLLVGGSRERVLHRQTI